MSEWGRCPKCGQYGVMNGHVCEPVWETIRRDRLEQAEQYGLDLWKKVYAQNAREAAELYVAYDDHRSAEFTEETLVVVRDQAGTLHYFRVTGELDPVYTAKEVPVEGAAREQNAAD